MKARDLGLALVATIVVAIICYGIAVARPQQPPPPSPPLPSGTTTSSRAVASTEHIIMRVNGEPVTEREFYAFAQQAPEEARGFYMSPEGRNVLATQLVKLKAIEQEARRLGVEADPEAKVRIDMARANISAAYALQKLIAPPKEAQLRAQYEKEKKNFESIDLYHILIAYQGSNVPPHSGKALSLADAMKKAEAIERRLREGTDFAQLAREESDDVTSAAQGGKLGKVAPSSLPPELQRAVGSLRANEISKPVRSAFGIHIFRSGAHTTETFDQVKAMFASRVQRQEADALLNRLQMSAKVERDPKFFAARGRP